MFLARVAYDGTDYVGWQVQPNGPTIQARLEKALEKVTGVRVPIVGSGRTDAGVHADAQAASFDVASWNHGPERLRRAWNVHLPDDIVVTHIETRPDGFHALRDCVEKRYRYQLQVAGPPDPVNLRYRWYVRGRPIQIDAFSDACQRLLGTHDFSCFEATGAPRPTSVRTIRRSDISILKDQTETRTLIDYRVAADGFLYNMVRNIVGTLIEIGQGKHPPQWIDELIAGRDRMRAGKTAPACGLFLEEAIYPLV